MVEVLGLRQQKRQATREAIVRAATRLFLKHGFADTHITEIAAAAGVSRRTFFLYFPTKEDLLFHHIEGHIEVALDALSGLDADATAWDAVQATMFALVDAFDVNPSGGDELAEIRRELVQSARGMPASLMVRLQSVHSRLLVAIQDRYSRRHDTSAHLGACIGAAVGAANTAAPETRRTAMRAAIRRAGQGFRPGAK